MFLGWRSNLDGTRMPEFNHIVIRSKPTSDGKYIDHLIIETHKLICLILIIMALGTISFFVMFQNWIPLSGSWPVVAALTSITLSPALGTYMGYKKYWSNYPE